MDRDDVIEKLESLRAEISRHLKWCEPEDLPHKPIRMTIVQDDIEWLKEVVKLLKKDDSNNGELDLLNRRLIELEDF